MPDRLAPLAALLLLPAAAAAQDPQPPSPAPPVRVLPIVGNPSMDEPDAILANLDAGPFVAGNTWWDHDGDGVVYIETRVGFLWDPADGARVFRVDNATYWTAHEHLPAAVADTGAVAGTRVFRFSLDFDPFLWTPAGGLQILPLPGPGWYGTATCLSADASLVGGTLRPGPFASDPASAAAWDATGLRLLDDGGALWSEVFAASPDGRTLAGDAGPGATALTAVRWRDAVLEVLGAVPGQISSSARFVSADGLEALGTALTASGTVLVHWDALGTPSSWAPPAGWNLQELRAANPTLSAAVGALADASGNQAPFLWTRAGGWTVLPEAGRPDDYDQSVALDVSDDGRRVVGQLRASAIFNGDPPSLGFLWVRGQGPILVNDLLRLAGDPDPDAWSAWAIRGDGRQIAVTGNLDGGDPHATNSALLDLRR